MVTVCESVNENVLLTVPTDETIPIQIGKEINRQILTLFNYYWNSTPNLIQLPYPIRTIYMVSQLRLMNLDKQN